jgi:naringenin degradation protein FdeD
MTHQQRLCALHDIEDGGAKGLWPNDRGRDQIVAVRRDQAVFVYHNSCPHYDRARLGWKKDAFLNREKTMIFCAAHGALFQVEDGHCVIGPCLGESLYKIHATVRDGDIFVATQDLPKGVATLAKS